MIGHSSEWNVNHKKWMAYANARKLQVLGEKRAETGTGSCRSANHAPTLPVVSLTDPHTLCLLTRVAKMASEI